MPLDDRHDEKCSIKEFVNRRREIFLLGLSTETHTDEIKNFHLDVQNKESRLKDKEACWLEKKNRFNSITKELNRRIEEATKRLNDQFQIRSEKELELKRLSRQARMIEARLEQKNKVEEFLCANKVSIAPEEERFELGSLR